MTDQEKTELAHALADRAGKHDLDRFNACFIAALEETHDVHEALTIADEAMANFPDEEGDTVSAGEDGPLSDEMEAHLDEINAEEPQHGELFGQPQGGDVDPQKIFGE